MSSVLLLVPLSLVLVAIAAGFFLSAVRGGQFDDLEQLDRRMPDDEP